MRAEGAESMMDLKERTKQSALCLIRMDSALPKSTEAKVIGRPVLCLGTSVGAHSRQGRYSHSGEHYGAMHPGQTLLGDLSHGRRWLTSIRIHLYEGPLALVPPKHLGATNVIGLRINDDMIDRVQWFDSLVRVTP